MPQNYQSAFSCVLSLTEFSRRLQTRKPLMPRIPEGEIGRLKAKVSIERLAGARGIRLERRAADLLGLCPFHEDREPSLVITPAKNLWHCLGACRTGGSVLDWVMKCNGVSFRHAVELLRADHPSLAAPGPVVRKATTAAVKLEMPFATDADDQLVLRQAVDYYHETLKESPRRSRTCRGEASITPTWLRTSGSDSPTGRSATGCRRQTGKPAPRSGADYSGLAFCGKAATSTSTDPWFFP
jgi:hypothetical protein